MELNKFDIVKTKVPFLMGAIDVGVECLVISKYLNEQNYYYVVTFTERPFLFVISEDQVDFVSSNALVETGELDNLIASEDMLSALEVAGVDNWEGYSYAMEVYEMEE